MKKIRTYLLFFCSLTLCSSCNKVLDLQPKDKISTEVLFSDPAGVKLYMANLYYQLPIEDFTFFREGFNYNQAGPNNNGLAPAHQTDEALHSQRGYLVDDADFNWWEGGFKLIRDVNLLIDAIPTLDVLEEDRNLLVGEAAFIRAYAYFALAKRYGGVPLILKAQDYTGDIESLKVPRSTEEETWDLVMAECDRAIGNLPETWSDGPRRATKWAAYALKSRAALFAASVAKYSNKAQLTGEAVNQKLAGAMTSAQAGKYYQACIEASEALIKSGKFALYKPNPTSPAEASENYRAMFEDPSLAPEEAIFVKGYTQPGNGYGHNYDIWFQPNQTTNGWPHPGRMNPTLELVDSYENYEQPGQPAPIITTEDGQIGDYQGFSAAKKYRHFSNPSAIFDGKDARLSATVILPGSLWKSTKIVIQAGFVKPDGTAVISTQDQVTVNGTTYYTYGAGNINDYSGFNTQGGNYTMSGFLFKKFLNQKTPLVPDWNQGITDFIDFRYAETLLNYAEAVAESGLGDQSLAAEGVNSIRRRAGFTTSIPLTLATVLRERRIELAFENKRLWDLIRRREYHEEFNNRKMYALLPLLDLRVQPAQYIFVRTYAVVPNLGARTFNIRSYYRVIPGIASNGLIQNPQY